MRSSHFLKIALAGSSLAAIAALLALALWPHARPAPQRALGPRIVRPPAAAPARPAPIRPGASGAPAAGASPAEAEVEVAPAPGAPVSIICRVLDAESGKPLSPVEVRLRGEHTRQRSRADEQGIARFYGIEPGRYILDGHSPTHMPAAREVTLWTPPLEIDLLLHHGHTLHGLVTLSGRAPLPGVEVRCEVVGVAAGRRTASGKDGRYRLDGLPAGPVEVEARSATMSPFVLQAAVEFPDGPPVDLAVDFAFEEPARCRGRVLTLAGQPVAGAAVSVAVKGTFAPYETTSAEDGSFAFAALPPGAAEFSARAERLVLGGRVAAELRSGRTAEVTLCLAGGGGLAGRVLDPNGRGFASVRVQAETAAGGDQAARAATDEEGRFAFPDLAPGVYRCRAICPGYPDALSDPIDLPAGAELTLPDLQLREGLDAPGEVVSDEGRPVGGARVEASREGARKAAARAVSAADGGFILRGLEPGAYEVRASAAGHARSTPRRVEIRAGAQAPIRLVLARRAVIVGVVRDGAGRPVADAFVASLAQVGRSVRTGADGAFRLETDSSASQPIVVHAAGYAAARPMATPGEDLVVVLESPRPEDASGLAIRGMIRVGGKPAEGLLIMAVAARAAGLPSAGDALVAASGPGGAFVLPVPAPGTYELAAIRRRGHEEHVESRTVEVGTQGASLTWDLEAFGQ